MALSKFALGALKQAYGPAYVHAVQSTIGILDAYHPWVTEHYEEAGTVLGLGGCLPKQVPPNGPLDNPPPDPGPGKGNDESGTDPDEDDDDDDDAAGGTDTKCFDNPFDTGY